MKEGRKEGRKEEWKGGREGRLGDREGGVLLECTYMAVCIYP
jgi:hypothetical protein